MPGEIPEVPTPALLPPVTEPVSDEPGSPFVLAGPPTVVPGAPITVDAPPNPWPETVPGC
jgi:hypothetical protein